MEGGSARDVRVSRRAAGPGRVWLMGEVLTLALTFITGTEMLDAILMKPFHKSLY